MTVDTKYNLGDEVWGEWYMEITRFKVTSISIFVVGNITSIVYDLEDTQDYTNDARMTEENLFPTKEELLKSL